MKSVVIHRIAVVMSALLLLAGIVAYLYLRQTRTEQPVAVSLYALVPADAMAVVETDDVVAFIDDSSDGAIADTSLPVSDIVYCLKEYVNAYLEASPHGLSTQLSKVLLSYHLPEGSMNQVLYCSVEADDVALLQQFFSRYILNPVIDPKILHYQGEEIAIYQLADGHSLAAYTTGNLLALSFSSELLQRVIDAQQQSGTLSGNAAFMNLQASKSSYVRTAVYQQKDNHWELIYQ
ncbi:MAG: hypothetical protein J6U14_07080 [Bacteroidaceae bacterium]|nr:hypothetical protein [Bacteroidaceae bacterium]